MRRMWRRFRAAKTATVTPRETGNLFAEVAHDVNQIVQPYAVRRWQRFDLAQLSPHIDEWRHSAEQSGLAHDWMIALILQAPRAAVAQRHMDKHPHGFDSAHTRLYELIDFNDSFVSTVLALPEIYLADFQDHARLLMDQVCKRLRIPCFSNEQYEAITHGLSREIAVYRGAIHEGFLAEMTSRMEDAKGVDMVITDPTSRRSVNVDVKTRSAYYYRLKDLTREGRLSVVDAERAELTGYCHIVNGHGGEARSIVLLRVDPGELGGIVNFNFENTMLLGETLRRVIAELGSGVAVEASLK